MAKPAADGGQKLGQKEDNLFRQVMRCYESKQYKKALKLADKILEKHADHGETLAMKGLIYSCLDKKAEAYKLVKQGVLKNMKSHVCWHVYGLLYRGDRNYAEAIKCYRQALRIDTDNLNILRDLGLLQMQMRDYAALAETRQKLLELRPSKASWLGFAVVHHLQGNYKCADVVLDSYELTMKLPTVPYECSEFLCYRALILAEGGDAEACINYINKNDSKITDAEFKHETLAECYKKLGKMEEAQKHCHELLKMNPENARFITYLAQAKGVNVESFTCEMDDADRAKLVEMLAELRELYPKSSAIQKAEVDVSTGDKFRDHIRAFITPFIYRTIPALASALKSCYLDTAKAAIVGEVLHEMEAKVAKDGVLKEGDESNPLVIVWLWMALSNHYLRLEQNEKAMEYCEKAIQHTPTVDMLYALKAKIYKHMGNMEEAVKAIDTARRMDLADRYYNTKCTRYLLRNNKYDEAEECMALFTSHPQPGQETDVWAQAVDMQVMWYELEVADCCYRMGDVHSAIKRYLLIDKHFQDFQEDQFDFHMYCLRKSNLRAYIGMIRQEDETKSGNRFYCYAAEKVVQCYLDINGKTEEELKEKLVPFVKKPTQRNVSKEQKEKEKGIDMQPDFDQPLEAALPFLDALLKYRKDKISTQLLAAKLHLARKKPILVLAALRRASKLRKAKENSELVALAKDFFEKPNTDVPAILEIISSEKPAIQAALGF